MKSLLVNKSVLFVLFFLTSFIFAEKALSTSFDDDDKRKRQQSEEMEPGVIIARFAPGVSVQGVAKTGAQGIDAIFTRYQVTAVEPAYPALHRMSASKKAALNGVDRLLQTFLVRFDEALNPELVAAALAHQEGVVYAHPVYRVQLTVMPQPFWEAADPISLPAVAVPNDSLFGQSTHLSFVNLPDAWDIAKTEGSVLIATVDAKTDWQHEDLQGNVWTNPGEVAGNGIDDDNNDFVDDLHGWNFGGDNADPGSTPNLPTSGNHGTWVTSVFSAVTNNTIGLAGSSWNAEFMALNTASTETDNALSTLDIWNSYAYAMANGADIINASLGGPRSCLSADQDLIDMGTDNGVLYVVAAGNSGNNIDIFPESPANCERVLTVGATQKTSELLAGFSNYGLAVDVYAPGSFINAAASGGGYQTVSGTSFASPLVAGIAALLKTVNPDLTADEMREQIRVTATPFSDLVRSSPRFEGNLNKGIVDAVAVLTDSSPSVRIVDAGIANAGGGRSILGGNSGTIQISLTNYLEPVSDLAVELVSFNPNVSVLSGSQSIASMNKGDSLDMEFQIFVSEDAPFNINTPLNINLSSSDYEDVDGFSLTVNNTIHDTGDIALTLTEEGNLGYNNFQGDSPGEGFRYGGLDWLFEGGLIMGTGVNTVSDNIRGIDGSTQDEDFRIEQGTVFGVIPGRVTTEEGALQLLDLQADNPLDIRVRLDSFADSVAVNDDFIILKYTIENMGATDLNDFYTGLFFDWDSPEDPQTDFASFDASRSMGIFSDGSSDASVFIGTRLLTTDAGFSYRAIDNIEIYGPTSGQDGFTDTEKWDFISGGLQTSEVNSSDVSTLMSSGPHAIPAGGSVEIVFAMVGGFTLEELQNNSDTAFALWENTLSGLSPNPVANEEFVHQPAFAFELGEAFPNPVLQSTTIPFQLEAAANVRLEIFDVLGRSVRVLVDESRSAGPQSVLWDGAGDDGQPLASGVYFYSISTQGASGNLLQESRKLVLVR